MSIWVWEGNEMGGVPRHYICCAVGHDLERVKAHIKAAYLDQVRDSPLVTAEMEPDWDVGWHRYDDQTRVLLWSFPAVGPSAYYNNDAVGTWKWDDGLQAYVWAKDGIRPAAFHAEGGKAYEIPGHWSAFRFTKKGRLKEVATEGVLA